MSCQHQSWSFFSFAEGTVSSSVRFWQNSFHLYLQQIKNNKMFDLMRISVWQSLLPSACCASTMTKHSRYSNTDVLKEIVALSFCIQKWIYCSLLTAVVNTRTQSHTPATHKENHSILITVTTWFCSSVLTPHLCNTIKNKFHSLTWLFYILFLLHTKIINILFHLFITFYTKKQTV